MATKKANPIAKALGAKGSIHKALGVKVGAKIPRAKLLKASKGSGSIAKKAALLLKLGNN